MNTIGSRTVSPKPDISMCDEVTDGLKTLLSGHGGPCFRKSDPPRRRAFALLIYTPGIDFQLLLLVQGRKS
jgi:hypothetical protein